MALAKQKQLCMIWPGYWNNISSDPYSTESQGTTTYINFCAFCVVQPYRMCVSFQVYHAFLPFFCDRRKPPCDRSVPVVIVSASLMDCSPLSPFPPSVFPSFFSHIISMYSPGGWLKGFLAGVRGWGRRDEEGVGSGWGVLWQWRRVVPITPYVWTGEVGVEVLFQLINRDTVLCSLCLSVSLSFPVSSSLHPQTLPLEIMCLVLTQQGLGTMTEVQFCSVRPSFYIKTL